jgi:L-lactate dehydrogenase complex protein LldF
MLIELRRDVVEHRIAPRAERWAFGVLGRVLQRPTLYWLAVRLGRALQRPFVRQGAIPRLPRFLGDWTRTRDLPPIAARTFQERWSALEREGQR